MLFSSATFIYLFLPAVLFFYYLVFGKRREGRNTFLLLASLFFYAWGEPRFVLVMIASIILNWLFGIQIERNRRKGQPCKNTLVLDIVCNLAILFVFKYLNYTTYLLQKITGLSVPQTSIALPIGISFFTFQAMSYVIDVYRGEAEAQTNLLNVGLYISFFPQLIAGPIVRYKTIADEIRIRTETFQDITDGFVRFVIGLSKKVLLANGFAALADGAFNTASAGTALSVTYSWLGAIAYTFQIFFDFSGYSDMAIGLGRMFGFHFQENFHYPYISSSVSEFWRRWHISLGTWFRDYVYIPLGGSRAGNKKTVRNLFLVWLLTGMWHGANMTFIVWGLMYFALITAEKLSGFEKNADRHRLLFRRVYTMFFVTLGWVVFRSDSLSTAGLYLKAMFGLGGNVFTDGLFQGYFIQNLMLLMIGAVVSTPLVRSVGRKLSKNSFWNGIRSFVTVILLILCVASLVSNSYNPFIYFQF